jgi:diguanylate cyclase (GGDEF)-like protein
MFKSGFSPFRNPKKTRNPATRSCDIFSDCLTALLPAERLAALTTALDGPVGFLTVRVADFYHFVGAHGESAGFRLLNRLRKEAAERFDEVFPSETLLFAEAVGLGETLLVFRLPSGGACGLPGRSLSLRLRLNAVMNHAAEERLPDTVTVEVGYAWINPVPEESAEAFHQRLFRAFCEAQRTAAPAFPPPNPSVTPPPRLSKCGMGSAHLKPATPLRDLIQPSLTAPPEAKVQAVEGMLADRPPMSSVVVVAGETPVGLVMNYNLGRQLGTRYGFALFYQREIQRLMDPDPLVVDIAEPVEEVAKAATNRENAKIYDDIIVTENGAFRGTISVQKMLDHLAEIQVKIAMGANPLTGLPGNVAIEQEINRRSANAIRSSLVYVDLDNFKVYNDAYGFDNGDRMILLTARTIRTAVEATRGESFVGHVGGDDFVVITEPEIAEPVAEEIAKRFKAEVPALYREADRDQGCIQGKGRDGVERKFPLVSVSIGIVDCEFQAAFTMEELSHRVAEIKKFAKSVPGNAFVRDRRTPIGAAPDEPEPASPRKAHGATGGG